MLQYLKQIPDTMLFHLLNHRVLDLVSCEEVCMSAFPRAPLTKHYRQVGVKRKERWAPVPRPSPVGAEAGSHSLRSLKGESLLGASSLWCRGQDPWCSVAHRDIMQPLLSKGCSHVCVFAWPFPYKDTHQIG